jgi:predicted alpha/beta hydrolase
MNAAPPAFLLLPALGVPARFYASLAEALAQRFGGVAETLDWPVPRTLADRLGGRPAVGYRELLQHVGERAHALTAAGAPVLLLGHSLGGHVGLLAAAQPGARIAGVVLVACGTPHWGAWPPASRGRMRLGITVIDTISRLLPWYPGRWIGFGGDQPRRLMRDWSALARSGDFSGMTGLADAEAQLRAAAPAVLALSVEGDDYAPPSATDALLAKLPRADIERAVFTTPTLKSLPPARRHVAWLREPAPVVEQLVRWRGAADG